MLYSLTWVRVTSRDLQSFDIRFDSKVMGRFENFRVGRACPLLVVVKRLKPCLVLSGTVYRLASSMSDHTPVLFNVLEGWNSESVVPHISFNSIHIRFARKRPIGRSLMTSALHDACHASLIQLFHYSDWCNVLWRPTTLPKCTHLYRPTAYYTDLIHTTATVFLSSYTDMSADSRLTYLLTNIIDEIVCFGARRTQATIAFTCAGVLCWWPPVGWLLRLAKQLA